jgi:hypothetical protein
MPEDSLPRSMGGEERGEDEAPTPSNRAPVSSNRGPTLSNRHRMDLPSRGFPHLPIKFAAAHMQGRERTKDPALRLHALLLWEGGSRPEARRPVEEGSATGVAGSM